MVGLGTILKIGGFLLRPFRAIRSVGRSIGLGIAVGGIGKALVGRENKSYNPAFDQKYSNFLKYSKSNGVSGEYYKDLNSVSKPSPNLDYTERIKNSLEIVDKMHEDKAIGKKEYRNLKDRLYTDFKEELEGHLGEDVHKKSIEDYLPVAASVFFFLSGILLLTPNLTGFSVADGLPKYGSNMFSIICFLLGISFLGIVVREKRNRTTRKKK